MPALQAQVVTPGGRQGRAREHGRHPRRAHHAPLPKRPVTETKYPLWKDTHDEPVKRPFRLWNAIEKRDMVHRYYSIEFNSLKAALFEAAFATVGTSIEVYDCRTARHLGTFTRKSTGQVSRWLAKDDERKE